MNERAIEVTVTGKVQGVGYRAWTHEQARARGLLGWVRNEDDGSVRALIAGEAAAVAAMQQALEDGPAAARVDEVRAVPADPPELSRFEIRR